MTMDLVCSNVRVLAQLAASLLVKALPFRLHGDESAAEEDRRLRLTQSFYGAWAHRVTQEATM